ncbi:MAG TPA: transcriptional regulator, partial [Pyrinomonadaceae bacterium]
MRGNPKRCYVFGDFRIDVTERVLFGEKGPISLTPKAFDTLLFLVENSGRVLRRDEIMSQVWPDSFVEENNLAQNISALRKLLGPEGKLIETVPKRGYRFVANVTEKWEDGSDLIVRERTRARVIVEEETDELDFGGISTFLDRRHPHLIDQGQHSREFELLPEKRPETMYARSGDVNIAYQVVGDAPLDLVFVMGWVSHLE